VILGGWASNNKYSFLGGLRSSAQLIAYELPLGLGILGVVLAAARSAGAIMAAQARPAVVCLRAAAGVCGVRRRGVCRSGPAAVRSARGEQELIGGYHTEYAGMKLLLFLVAEFLHMITASFLIVILFLGGWHFRGSRAADAEIDSLAVAILRIVVLHGKIFLVIVFFMWCAGAGRGSASTSS
jgi:NADH-quinone oxidoreductase subunit H